MGCGRASGGADCRWSVGGVGTGVGSAKGLPPRLCTSRSRWLLLLRLPPCAVEVQQAYVSVPYTYGTVSGLHELPVSCCGRVTCAPLCVSWSGTVGYRMNDMHIQYATTAVRRT